MNNDDKKTTKMIVAVGWGVVIGIVTKLIMDQPKVILFTGIFLLGLATLFFVLALLGSLIDETFSLLGVEPESKLETVVGQASNIREMIEDLKDKCYFVPKTDLREAIEAIELNDTSTALALLQSVVNKAGRDE